jgi:hypothetical protein
VSFPLFFQSQKGPSKGKMIVEIETKIHRFLPEIPKLHQIQQITVKSNKLKNKKQVP